MSKKKATFTPIVRSDISFANGVQLRIEQVNARGACRVRDMADNGRVMNHTHSIEKAWASVRYVGGITDMTNRSVGAPETRL